MVLLSVVVVCRLLGHAAGSFLLQAPPKGLKVYQFLAPDPVVQVVHDRLAQSANRTVSRLSKVGELPELLGEVVNDVRIVFLPGWEFQNGTFIKALCTILLGTVWFIIYFEFLYQDDRKESLDRWKNQLEADGDSWSILSPRGCNPDVILVFTHPTYDAKDASNPVSIHSLDKVMVSSEDRDLEELHELRLSAPRSAVAAVESIRKGLFTMSSASMERSTDTFELAVDRARARKALLKDLYRLLPTLGFDVTAFSSIDDDELFVCISLSNWEGIDYYLSRSGALLQLRQDIAERLGIRQDPSDPASSPPSVPYSRALVQQLYEQGILKSTNPLELFRNFNNSGTCTCVNTKDLIWTICHEINNHVDLDAAVDEGLLIAWYPVHNPPKVMELKATWANWRSMLDISFVQPVPLIREYFGVRIAFLFAWNGVYCKALLALVSIAILQMIAIRICNDFLDVDVVNGRQVIGFCIFVVLWARIAQNLWTREQGFFLELWNIHGHTMSQQVTRTQFEGFPAPSPLDANILDDQFPKRIAFFRSAFTTLITVFFCGCVAACIFLWLLIFRGKMGLISSVMLSIQIKIFECIFSYMADAMTEYENHKFQHDYHNSLLWKLFLFNFVNNYSAFIAISIRNAWMGCHDDCLNELRKQIAITLCVLVLCSIAQMLAEGFKVRFNLMWELRQLKKRNQQHPPRYLVEEQSKYAVITGSEELQSMMTLVISLGFIFLFGGVAPIVVPFCFCVFAVQLRAFAIMLTTCAKRPFPHQSLGIGNWSICITFLMSVGIAYSGFLFVAYGQTFKDTKVLGKMTGLLLYCFAGFSIWALVDAVLPPEDTATGLLVARRKYLTGKVMKKAEAGKLEHAKHEALGRSPSVACYAKQISSEEWGNIPWLDNMPVGPLTPIKKESELTTPRPSSSFGRRATV